MVLNSSVMQGFFRKTLEALAAGAENDQENLWCLLFTY
jgi:hypothetical protein